MLLSCIGRQRNSLIIRADITKRKMNIAVLLVTLCYVASGEIHSWKAFYTGTTGLTEFPEFVAINVLDNEVMGYFDSKTNRFESKQSWMAETLGQQYEQQETNTLRGVAPAFHNNIRIARDRFNQSEGVHTLQQMVGCQWDDESGATNGLRQYGYDGEDFISIDLENMRWIAPVKQSEITKNKWEADRGIIEQWRNYLTNICIDWLKKYVRYGSSTLGRKVSPKATLLQKGPGVVCHATGFYPDAVMITWKKNGEEMQDDVDVGETLPNEDGTFQKRAVLTVSPEERKKGQYSCEVAHKSGEPIVMIFEEANNHLPIIIAVGVIAAVALVVGIAAIVIKKRRGYTKASQSDTSSDTSTGTPKA